MDGDDLYRALRIYHEKRYQELLEALVSTTDIEKVRGQIKELRTSQDKLKELMKTRGEDEGE